MYLTHFRIALPIPSPAACLGEMRLCVLADLRTQSQEGLVDALHLLAVLAVAGHEEVLAGRPSLAVNLSLGQFAVGHESPDCPFVGVVQVHDVDAVVVSRVGQSAEPFHADFGRPIQDADGRVGRLITVEEVSDHMSESGGHKNDVLAATTSAPIEFGQEGVYRFRSTIVMEVYCGGNIVTLGEGDGSAIAHDDNSSLDQFGDH